MRRKALVFLWVLGGGLLVVAAVLAVVASITVKVKRVRAHPDRSSVLALAGPRASFRAFKLYLLLRPGSRLYDAALLPWIYSDESGVADTAANRRLLESHLLRVPHDLALEYVPFYPLTPGPRLLPLLGEALEQGRYDTLQVLDRSAEGRRLWRAWLERSGSHPLARPKETEEGESKSLFMSLLELDAADLPNLLDRLVPPVAEQKEAAQVDPEEVQSVLASRPAAAGRLMAWAEGSLARGTVSLKFVQPVLVALLATRSTADVTAQFLVDDARLTDRDLLGVVSPNCDQIEGADLECSLPASLPGALLQRLLVFADRSPPIFLGLFHGLLNARDARAVEIARRVLRQPDSEVRKGVIVLLQRYGELGAEAPLDDAFRGSARRTVLFERSEEYSSSEATKAYERLSGHAYDTIGKRFPPFLGGRTPEPSDAQDWRQFIDEYPWFPATDDAYYRLAHVHFIAGELDLAEQTITEFRQRTFVDRDVESYVDALATVIEGARQNPAPELAPRLAHAGEDVDWMAGYRDHAEVVRIEKSVLAVDWLMANESAAYELDLDRSFLEHLRLDLDSARKVCRESDFEGCTVPDRVARLRSRADEAQLEAASDGGFTIAFLHALLGRE